MQGGNFHLAVEIDFQGQGCSVEHRPAIVAGTQMVLDFTAYFWSEAPFQILTDQSNCSFACHTHNGPPVELGLGWHE